MITSTDSQYFGRNGVNYFTTPGFENGNGDWSEFTTTYVNNVPTTITAGAADIATPSSLLGVGGLRGKVGYYAIFTATPAGQGLISNVLTIDTVDRAKVMTVSFEYLIAAGGNFNASGTSTQSVEVWVYDVTNAAWIQPAGYRGMNQTNSGSNNLCGFFQCTFQTPSNGGQFRVALIVKNAVTCTINFDTFYFGPQSTVQGAAISDWVSSTPTYSNAGTTSSSVHSTRRVGDTLQIQGRTVFATAGAAAVLRLRIPSSIGTIDTTKVQTGNLAGTVGSYFAQIGGGIFNGNVTLTTTANEVSFIPDGAGGSHLGSAFGLNTELTYTLSVPISGWSSNTVMSQDTDTRVVAFTGSFITTSIPTGTLDAAKIIAPGSSQDTHGAYATGLGTYTVPVSGFYKITHQNSISLEVARIFRVGYSINSTTQFTKATILTNGGATFTITGIAVCAGIEKLNAGDIIRFAVAHDNAAATSLTNDPRFQIYTIERLSGPATIAASETVGCTYDTLSANTVTGAGIDLIYTNKVFDTHGAYNTSTGEYTVPVSGEYTISGQYRAVTTAMTIGFGTTIFVRIDGTLTKYLGLVRTQTASGIIREVLGGPVTLRLNAGQKIKFGASSDTNTALDVPQTQFNWMSIMRTGN